jgi:hypothetical protein
MYISGESTFGAGDWLQRNNIWVADDFDTDTVDNYTPSYHPLSLSRDPAGIRRHRLLNNGLCIMIILY